MSVKSKWKVVHCRVPGCGSNSRERPDLRFHSFPLEGTSHLYVTNEADMQAKMDRRKIWEMILLLKYPAALHHRVCSLHFQASDYYKPDDYSPFARLYNTTIPTLNLPQEYQEKFETCMVKICSNRSDKNDSVEFFTESSTNALRWILWRKVLGVRRNAQDLVVCSDHFVQGYPSDDPKNVDFVPSRRLWDNGIEEVNVNDSYIIERDEDNEDPLKLGDADSVEPAFDLVEDLPIKEEFPDFDEILQSIKTESVELDSFMHLREHSYFLNADK